MFGNADFSSYDEPRECEWREAQMSAERIAEKFKAGEFRELVILDTEVPEEAQINEMEFYAEADEDGPRCVLIEWSASEQESYGERRNYSGETELVPEEKFNILYY